MQYHFVNNSYFQIKMRKLPCQRILAYRFDADGAGLCPQALYSCACKSATGFAVSAFEYSPLFALADMVRMAGADLWWSAIHLPIFFDLQPHPDNDTEKRKGRVYFFVLNSRLIFMSVNSRSSSSSCSSNSRTFRDSLGFVAFTSKNSTGEISK